MAEIDDDDDFELADALSSFCCPRNPAHSVYETTEGDWCPECDLFNKGDGWKPTPKFHMRAGKDGTRCGPKASESWLVDDPELVTCKRCLAIMEKSK